VPNSELRRFCFSLRRVDYRKYDQLSWTDKTTVASLSQRRSTSRGFVYNSWYLIFTSVDRLTKHNMSSAHAPEHACYIAPGRCAFTSRQAIQQYKTRRGSVLYESTREPSSEILCHYCQCLVRISYTSTRSLVRETTDTLYTIHTARLLNQYDELRDLTADERATSLDVKSPAGGREGGHPPTSNIHIS